MTWTRRGLLIAGASATAGLIGARGAVAAPTTTDWATLKQQLGGQLYLPGSSEYATYIQLFDPRYDSARPAALARVSLASQASAVVNFARAHGVAIRPRSGGHSYVGASSGNGYLVVDVRPRNWFKWPTSTSITVAAGARLYAVHQELSAKARLLATGSCPTVGVAGLTLGGGIGFYARNHGVTSDQLLSATIVTADGVMRVVDSTHEPDLFWACRGGGGGNFGIVLDFTFRTAAASDETTFKLSYPSSAAQAVLLGWARWMTTAAREVSAVLSVSTSGVSLRGVCPAGRGPAHAGDAIAAIGQAPSSTSYRTMSHLEMITYLAGGTTESRQSWSAGSDIVRTMTSGAAAGIVRAIDDARSRGIGAVAIVDPLSGAVSAVSSTATAFPWRGCSASVQWYTSNSSAAGRDWVARAHGILGGASAGRYINYLENGQPASVYYGPNLGRLQEVKGAYDPSNLFHSGVPITALQKRDQDLRPGGIFPRA